MAALRRFAVLTSNTKTKIVHARDENDVRNQMARLNLQVIELEEMWDEVHEQREFVFHDADEIIKTLKECRDIKTPKELESYRLPLGAERFYPEPERVFHDTVPLPDEELKAMRKRAKKQNDVVLQLFKDNPHRNFTPPEMFETVKMAGGCAILTSIRRSLTNLTKQGRLTKCMYSESRKGAYGTLNRTWKFNEDYLPPLNPKK